jgi:hypothetical protein
MCILQVSWEKPIFFVSCVEIHKLSILAPKFVFLRTTQKYRFLMKQHCENIHCQELRVKFFIIIFWQFKLCLKQISKMKMFHHFFF